MNVTTTRLYPPPITKAARDIRIGDTLADGTIVYDIAPSALTPGSLTIASARNGRSGCQVVTPGTHLEVRP